MNRVTHKMILAAFTLALFTMPNLGMAQRQAKVEKRQLDRERLHAIQQTQSLRDFYDTLERLLKGQEVPGMEGRNIGLQLRLPDSGKLVTNKYCTEDQKTLELPNELNGTLIILPPPSAGVGKKDRLYKTVFNNPFSTSVGQLGLFEGGPGYPEIRSAGKIGETGIRTMALVLEESDINGRQRFSITKGTIQIADNVRRDAESPCLVVYEFEDAEVELLGVDADQPEPEPVDPTAGGAGDAGQKPAGGAGTTTQPPGGGAAGTGAQEPGSEAGTAKPPQEPHPSSAAKPEPDKTKTGKGEEEKDKSGKKKKIAKADTSTVPPIKKKKSNSCKSNSDYSLLMASILLPLYVLRKRTQLTAAASASRNRHC